MSISDDVAKILRELPEHPAMAELRTMLHDYDEWPTLTVDDVAPQRVIDAARQVLQLHDEQRAAHALALVSHPSMSVLRGLMGEPVVRTPAKDDAGEPGRSMRTAPEGTYAEVVSTLKADVERALDALPPDQLIQLREEPGGDRNSGG